ncbi:hypothetical protein JOQ06_020542, partial [Pogonophryne albipinna]
PSGANQIHRPSQNPSQPPIIINLDGHLIGTVVNEQYELLNPINKAAVGQLRIQEQPTLKLKLCAIST